MEKFWTQLKINYPLHHTLTEKGVPVHIKAEFTCNGTQLDSRQSWWGQKNRTGKKWAGLLQGRDRRCAFNNSFFREKKNNQVLTIKREGQLRGRKKRVYSKWDTDGGRRVRDEARLDYIGLSNKCGCEPSDPNSNDVTSIYSFPWMKWLVMS